MRFDPNRIRELLLQPSPECLKSGSPASCEEERQLLNLVREYDSYPLHQSQAWNTLLKEDPDAFRIAFFRAATRLLNDSLTAETIAQLESFPLEGDCHRLRELCLAFAEFRDGHARGAIDRVEKALRSVRRVDMFSAFVEQAARYRLGQLLRRVGHFSKAIEQLRLAREVIEEYQLGEARLRVVQNELATLYWSSGQVERALELHSDPRQREAAQRNGDENFLIASYLSAGKCAIDLGLAAKANFELGEAKDLLDSSRRQWPEHHAFLVLYSAELDTLWGNDREGIHLFEYAVELFESLDPPFYPGVMEAKIGLVQFAIRAGRHEDAMQEIRALVDEADALGCDDARTRLLAEQANLILQSQAPEAVLEEGYQDLTQRVHMMNNPRLSFMAYADLYAYTRRRHSHDEQKFWLDRLRGLERVLDPNAFEGLYRDFVLERYRQEIEAPLDESGLDTSVIS